MTTNRQVLYGHRPDGQLQVSDFQVTESEVPSPGPGQVLCRTILLSIDAANRAWMQGRTYRDELRAGEVMDGFGMCEVMAAADDTGLTAGSIVTGMSGWREYAVLPAASLIPVEVRGPLSHHMSVLGVTGLTAYFGLLQIGRPQAGETVLISAAAGATGNVVGQIAKIKECRVVGLTGSDDKGKLLIDELGFDAYANHRSPTLADDLRSACPEGVDLYFDNVGGPLLEVVLRRLRVGGRVVCCGAVSQYDTGDPAAAGGGGIRGVPGLIVTKRLRLEGFIVSDNVSEWPDAQAELAGWIRSGQLKVLEDVLEGLDRAPAALVGLLAGDNVGKRLVRVGPDPS
jgi:hypothetical protein